ncbi:MAG: DUF692 family protein [Meiothermus sp.]|nr:DUF692 family protein [Meiothermus sp.]
MLSLAANGIPALYELLYNYDLPLEFIKCPLSPDSRGEVERARQYLPVVLHGWGPPDYSICSPSVPEPELLQELAEKSGTPFVSAHLDYTPERDGDMGRGPLLERIVNNVEELKRLTGKEVLLENVPWYAHRSRPRYTTDPEFFAEALEIAGAWLLLDLSHATVAAWHRHEDAGDYVGRMPLERALEIHVSGPRETEAGLNDWHMPLRESDYLLLEQTLRQTPSVKVLTLEYMIREKTTLMFREPEGPAVMLQQVMRLDELRRRFNHRAKPAPESSPGAAAPPSRLP